MSDPITRDTVRRGKSIGAKRARNLLAELDAVLAEAAQYRHANTLAAQAYVQLEAQIGILESQLGSTHELLGVLQDASRPAATILFNLTQQPAIDDRTREMIQQTLAPLDAALAATKGGSE